MNGQLAPARAAIAKASLSFQTALRFFLNSFFVSVRIGIPDPQYGAL